jgi:magnesium transporter
MSFEVTKDLIDELKTLIAEAKDSEIQHVLTDMHPADAADIIEALRREEGAYIFKLLDEEFAADTLIELEEGYQEKLLRDFTSEEITDVIDKVESDDAADVLNTLPEEMQEEVISHLSDQDLASDIIDLMNYEEGMAGALMAKELIKVNQNWTVATCIREMRRQNDDIDNIYTIYVVDDHDILLGRLSLRKLLFSSQSTRTLIKEIFNDDRLISVGPTESTEEVASIMEKYDLVVIPVVNEQNMLLGRITFDDVVDVIVEEAEKDYQMASGISEDVESRDSIWTLTRARLPWLLIGLGGGILGAKVISGFNIHENIEMALFIPLIAAMGGNVGVQSAAIVVQGLANKSIRSDEIAGRLVKELGVALLNGLICAAILLMASVVLNYDVDLGITVSIALLAVVIFAALFGTFIPLLLDKYKIDPALATGPFITTANDIFGLIIYFVVGGIVRGGELHSAILGLFEYL